MSAVLENRIAALERELADLKLALDTDEERNGWMHDHMRETPNMVVRLLISYLENFVPTFSSVEFREFAEGVMLAPYRDAHAERNALTEWLEARTRETLSEMIPTDKDAAVATA